MNPLLGRGFKRNIKPYFIQKIKVKIVKVLSAAILLGALRVNATEMSYLFQSSTDSTEATTYQG